MNRKALARLVGWSITLDALARRLRGSQCGKKDAEVVAGCTAQAARHPEESAWVDR